jgi:K+-sensing histidine kinase KdpD
MGKEKGDSVVKIDSALLEDVEAFINLEENKFKYVNRKQFIDIAVAEYLRAKKGVKK